jgi:hypothetical protein
MQHVLTNKKVSNIIASGIHTRTEKTKTNLFERLLAWCGTQEHNRLLWMALTFAGLIILALPCTAFPFLLLGVNSLNLWILTCVINVPVIAINLAAQPIKIILPVLFISWIADAIVILSCITVFLVR